MNRSRSSPSAIYDEDDKSNLNMKNIYIYGTVPQDIFIVKQNSENDRKPKGKKLTFLQKMRNSAGMQYDQKKATRIKRDADEDEEKMDEKSQVIIDHIMDEFREEQRTILQSDPTKFEDLCDKQKQRMSILLSKIGYTKDVFIPDESQFFATPITKIRNKQELFKVLVKAKSDGTFTQFKGKSLTGYNLFVGDCNNATQFLALKKEEIPILDQLGAKLIDFLIPRTSKIINACSPAHPCWYINKQL
uniref:Non-structural maintenance of chromosomes element 4 n=1 Tax=Parastrongyloides trichosuri TaxID=131310 RepID=A0A0N4Z690_PARTI